MKTFHKHTLRGGGLAGVMAVSALFFATPAQAGYEYTTSAAFCTSKVDAPGDGSDLRLPIGEFDLEFWGFGLDTASGVSITDTDSAGSVGARIVARHNGFENAARHCDGKGSLVIHLTVRPADATSGFHKRLNIGTASDSRVPLSIRRIPKQDTLVWGTTEGFACLGTRILQDNNRTMIVQLPAGHQADRSNCRPAINLNHEAHEDFKVDAAAAFNLHFNGLPAAGSPDVASLASAYVPSGTVKFNLDAFAVRAITEPLISNISVAGPNGLTSNTVRLEIRPAIGQGIVSVTAAPVSITEGDPTGIRTQIATAAPAAGQPLDFTVNSAACFNLAPFPRSPRFADPKIRTFTIAAGQTSGLIQLRSVQGVGCSALGAGVRHTITMFTPGTDPVTCPVATCRAATVNVVARPQ